METDLKVPKDTKKTRGWWVISFMTVSVAVPVPVPMAVTIFVAVLMTIFQVHFGKEPKAGRFYKVGIFVLKVTNHDLWTLERMQRLKEK